MSPGPAKRKKEKYPGDKCLLCLVLGSVVVMVSSPPSPLHCYCHQSTCDPPHEQLLMRLGQVVLFGAAVYCLLPVPCLCLLFFVCCSWFVVVLCSLFTVLGCLPLVVICFGWMWVVLYGISGHH
jgi:hypothetical protein